MTVRASLITLASLLASILLAASLDASRAEDEAGQALLVLTGRESEIDVPRYRLASTQAVFDAVWIEHMGERVQRAAQGWPMTPRIDFAACEAVFLFGGDGINANGYRVLDLIEEDDALTLRFERSSYQTSSLEGRDVGEPARPWAMALIPATDRTLLLEENVQARIGGPAVWKQRAAFPGRIGVGRTVGGTRQGGE